MLLSLGLLLGATTLATIAYLRSNMLPGRLLKAIPLQEKLWDAGEVRGAGADPHQLLLWHQALEAQ